MATQFETARYEGLSLTTATERNRTMCFVEYNWTADCWQFRIGDRFTDYRGTRSLPTLQAWRDLVAQNGCTLVKTDTRTYELKCEPQQ